MEINAMIKFWEKAAEYYIPQLTRAACALKLGHLYQHITPTDKITR